MGRLGHCRRRLAGLKKKKFLGCSYLANPSLTFYFYQCQLA